MGIQVAPIWKNASYYHTQTFTFFSASWSGSFVAGLSQKPSNLHENLFKRKAKCPSTKSSQESERGQTLPFRLGDAEERGNMTAIKYKQKTTYCHNVYRNSHQLLRRTCWKPHSPTKATRAGSAPPSCPFLYTSHVKTTTPVSVPAKSCSM